MPMKFTFVTFLILSSFCLNGCGTENNANEIVIDPSNKSGNAESASVAPLSEVSLVSEELVDSVPLEPVLAEKPSRPPVKAPKSVKQEETAAPVKREIKLLVVEPPDFKKIGKEKALRVSFDDLDLLRVLNMEPVPVNAVEYFPPWLNALDGQKIRLRGFMYPPYEETGIKRFLLARDNDICCFGRDPKEYDIISVKMKEGTDTKYIQNRPFDVIATFHIRPKKWDDEKLLRLYALEDAVIINK